jgi:hypothetical protein
MRIFIRFAWYGSMVVGPLSVIGAPARKEVALVFPQKTSAQKLDLLLEEVIQSCGTHYHTLTEEAEDMQRLWKNPRSTQAEKQAAYKNFVKTHSEWCIFAWPGLEDRAAERAYRNAKAELKAQGMKPQSEWFAYLTSPF